MAITYFKNGSNNYSFEHDLDMSSFTKHIFDKTEEDFLASMTKIYGQSHICSTAACVDENILNDDDTIISKEKDDWFVFRKNKEPQRFFDYIINEAKVDPSVLGDSYYKQVFHLYALDKGVNYTQEDFDKEILSGKIFYEFCENKELLDELNNLKLKQGNTEIKSENETNLNPSKMIAKVAPEEIIGYIKDDKSYIFPFNPEILDDAGTMHAFRADLHKRNLDEIKQLLEKIREKNEKLRNEIAFFRSTNLQRELKNNANLSDELRDLKSQNTSYNPHDSSALDELKKEYREGKLGQREDQSNKSDKKREINIEHQIKQRRRGNR